MLPFVMRFFPVGASVTLVASLLYCLDGLLGWPVNQIGAWCVLMISLVSVPFCRRWQDLYCERKGIARGSFLKAVSYGLALAIFLTLYFLPRFLGHGRE